MNLRAPFPWFGGKSRAASLIWSRFGAVANYVEPFAGSLAVLLARPTEPRIETVNDLDANVANFWRATQADPEAVAKWADWPVNEADLHARHRWLVGQLPAHREKMMRDPDYFDAKIAGWWCWGLSQWIGSGWCDGRLAQKRPAVGGGGPAAVRGDGGFTSGRGVHSLNEERNHRISRQVPRCNGLGGQGLHAARTESIYLWFLELHQRLRRVRICCGDWRRITGPSVIYGNGPTAILLDPPYNGDERTGLLYAEDSSTVAAEACAWAIEHGDDPGLRIALCGYAEEHTMPRNWNCATWMAPSGFGGGKQRHRERIWFSPHCLNGDGPLFEVGDE